MSANNSVSSVQTAYKPNLMLVVVLLTNVSNVYLSCIYYLESLCHEATNETNDCPATCFTPVKAALDACPNDAVFKNIDNYRVILIWLVLKLNSQLITQNVPIKDVYVTSPCS